MIKLRDVLFCFVVLIGKGFDVTRSWSLFCRPVPREHKTKRIEKNGGAVASL